MSGADLKAGNDRVQGERDTAYVGPSLGVPALDGSTGIGEMDVRDPIAALRGSMGAEQKAALEAEIVARRAQLAAEGGSGKLKGNPKGKSGEGETEEEPG